MRQCLLDRAAGVEIGDGVLVVLFYPGSDGKDVRVEDDVLGRKADLLGEDPICSGADLDLALGSVRLALLIERHDDDCRAVLPNFLGAFDELGFAFLEADRIDKTFALNALEAGVDHAPVGRVDDDRYPTDVGLRGDEIEELCHRFY